MKELVFTRSLLPTMERNASKTGFIDAGSGRSTTFGEHLDRVARLSGALSGELGVSPGDRVAVLGANSVPYVELWHAGLLGAAVVNPLNSRFSAEELAYVLADSGSSVAFVDASFAPVIDSIRAKTDLRHVVLLGEGDAPADLRYEELLAGATARFPDEPDEDDTAVLIYTGGTTGRPKGVILSQRAEVLNQYHFAMQGLWNGEKPYLIQTPMFHGATMLGILGAPMFGNPTVVLGAFEPSASLDATQKFGVGSTVLIPTMIGMMLNHPSYDTSRLASLDWIVFGGSPIPTPVLNKLIADLPDTKILQGYGMTEGCTINTIMTDADSRGGARGGSAGRALTGVKVVAKDEAGNVLPAGEVGEICVQGGQFTTGYWNLPEETDKALHDGWYHSGDVGYIDSEGYLFLVDRAKDMIISGGENVYSSEVENAVATHPSVLQVAVIGVPHDLWGEMVHAVVVLRDGLASTADELIAHARTTIAGYKVPRSIEFRADPLPVSAAGKVLKRELREPHWQGHDRAI